MHPPRTPLDFALSAPSPLPKRVFLFNSLCCGEDFDWWREDEVFRAQFVFHESDSYARWPGLLCFFSLPNVSHRRPREIVRFPSWYEDFYLFDALPPLHILVSAGLLLGRLSKNLGMSAFYHIRFFVVCTRIVSEIQAGFADTTYNLSANQSASMRCQIFHTSLDSFLDDHTALAQCTAFPHFVLARKPTCNSHIDPISSRIPLIWPIGQRLGIFNHTLTTLLVFSKFSVIKVGLFTFDESE